jgi:hypothetical protein
MGSDVTKARTRGGVSMLVSDSTSYGLGTSEVSKVQLLLLLRQELDKVVILRLFCDKIELIASKPTLEIREGCVLYDQYERAPFFFCYLLVYP